MPPDQPWLFCSTVAFELCAVDPSSLDALWKVPFAPVLTNGRAPFKLGCILDSTLASWLASIQRRGQFPG